MLKQAPRIPWCFYATLAYVISTWVAAVKCRSVPFAGVGREILLEFILLVAKFIRVGRLLFLRGNIGPFLGIFAVDLQPLLQSWLCIGLDRIHRAFRLAHTAI